MGLRPPITLFFVSLSNLQRQIRSLHGMGQSSNGHEIRPGLRVRPDVVQGNSPSSLDLNPGSEVFFKRSYDNELRGAKKFSVLNRSAF